MSSYGTMGSMMDPIRRGQVIADEGRRLPQPSSEWRYGGAPQAPAPSPSMPALQAPSMPTLQAPSMPTLQAPSLSGTFGQAIQGPAYQTHAGLPSRNFEQPRMVESYAPPTAPLPSAMPQNMRSSDLASKSWNRPGANPNSPMPQAPMQRPWRQPLPLVRSYWGSYQPRQQTPMQQTPYAPMQQTMYQSPLASLATPTGSAAGLGGPWGFQSQQVQSPYVEAPDPAWWIYRDEMNKRLADYFVKLNDVQGQLDLQGRTGAGGGVYTGGVSWNNMTPAAQQQAMQGMQNAGVK